MSLSVYSAQSAEANRLKFGEFEIYYDQEQDTVIIKTGKDQVYFNTLYNKDEVDQLIAQGVDPTSFENWIFNRVMMYSFATGSAIGVVSLKELLDYLSRDMQALNIHMNGKVDSRNVIDFDSEVKPSVYQIYNASSLYEALKELMNNKLDSSNVVAFDASVEPTESQIYNASSMYEALKELMNAKVDVSSIVAYESEVEPTENQIYNASSMYEALKELMNQKVDSSNVVSYDAEVEPSENQIYNDSSMHAALKELMNEKVDSSNVVAFDSSVEPTENQIYNAPSMYDLLKEVLTTSDLVLWNQDVKPELKWNVYNAQSLWDKITSIKECHCDPKLMDFLRELKQISTIDPPTAIGNLKSFVLRGNIKAMGAFMCSNLPMKSNFIKRPDLPTEVNEEENDYNAVNDYEPFDPDNPVYGTFYLPCCLDVTGTINGIHTKDILTKDDIDDLGASHFRFIDGAPPFTVCNETITFETNDTTTYLYINLSDDVNSYLRTVEDSIPVFKVEFIKTHVYDPDDNLVQSVTLDNIGYDPMRYRCIKLKKRDGGGLSVEYTEANKPCIETDKEETGYYMNQLYSEGQITLQYILPQSRIRSDNSTVECDVIKAKNAFDLRETDQLYLYEPTVITDKTVGDHDYWYQLYHIDSSTSIVDNQIFELTDYYLGFTFSLNWSSVDNKWVGYNSVQAVKEDTDRYSDSVTIQHDYFAIYLEHSETNSLWLTDIYKYDLSGNWIEVLSSNNHLHWFYHKSGKDRVAIDSSEIVVKGTATKNLNGGTYSYMNFTIPDLINLDDFNASHHSGDLIECDIVMDSGTTTCSWSISASYDTDQLYHGTPDVNMIHILGFNKGVEIENTTGNTKDIELFIRKDIHTLNPDFPLSPSDNIFTAINAKKYYQVKPYPESCSTLYTDLCIKSSKVITADNITTMAADLNYVQNFTYDLEEEIKQVDQKCNYALAEIEDLKGTTSALSQTGKVLTIMSSVSLAIEGVVGIAGIAMNGKNIWNAVRTAFVRIRGRPGYDPFRTTEQETSIVLGKEPAAGPYDDTPSNVLPENSHIAGNIFMKFINDIRGRLRCKVVMKDSTDELYKDLGTSYFNNDTHQPVYMIGTDEDYFKQTLYSSSDYFCYSDADNYDLYESVMSGETVLYLLHILQGEMVDMGNRIVKYTDRFMLSSDMIQVDDETKTLTLNKLMIENLADEQLVIRNELSSVLFSLSKAVFENPVAIHDTLTVTHIVCDDLKNSSDKKYITEDDIDVDIMKDVIKVLQDDRIQITCTQLHCDLITNTAFEPYALEKNHYTKTEADERFALKNELTAPDLSEYITKEEVEKGFVVNDLEPELVFNEGTISSDSWKSVCFGNNVFVAISYEGKCVWSEDGKTFTEGTNLNSIEWYSVCYGNGLFVAVGSNKCAWSEDGKTFTEGRMPSNGWMNVCYGNGLFIVVGRMYEFAWSEDGKTFNTATMPEGYFYNVCYGNGVFVAVSTDGKCAWSTDGKTFTEGTISSRNWSCICYGNGLFVAMGGENFAWSEDGKTFTEGTMPSSGWINVCYGNDLFVAISDYGVCSWSKDGKTFNEKMSLEAFRICYGNGLFVTVKQGCSWGSLTKPSASSFALKEELEEYVATETLEDVVSQINSKFDSQKRRWTFKLTMNANTTTTTLDLSESIDEYNPVLSNSDGKHVFVYQETNNGFEMIVLTVTLSGLTLNVQSDKQSKNNYEVYLSFDEL